MGKDKGIKTIYELKRKLNYELLEANEEITQLKFRLERNKWNGKNIEEHKKVIFEIRQFEKRAAKIEMTREVIEDIENGKIFKPIINVK